MHGVILVVATGVDLVTNSLAELNKVPVRQLHSTWPRPKDLSIQRTSGGTGEPLHQQKSETVSQQRKFHSPFMGPSRLVSSFRSTLGSRSRSGASSKSPSLKETVLSSTTARRGMVAGPTSEMGLWISMSPRVSFASSWSSFKLFFFSIKGLTEGLDFISPRKEEIFVWF